MTLEQDLRRLVAIPHLGLLGTEALRLIAFSAETRTFRTGDVLFRQGEPADSGFVVLVGSVAIEGPNRDDFVVVGPGALLGERALMAPIERSATATAREPATVLKISRNLFYRVMSEFPGSAERLRDALAKDLSLRLGQA